MNFDHDTGRIDTILYIDTSSAPPLGGTTGTLTIEGTGALILPSGTSAQQPTGTAGMIRYNTDLSRIESWNGTSWVSNQLNTELSGLSSLSSNGIVTRTASGTYTSRTISGTTGNITVTNGDGVSGNPTIDLATVGTAVTGQLVKITTDAYGRVTATSAVTAGDITALVDSTYVNVSGDTMALNANLTFNGGEVLGLPLTPTTAGSATSKAYVDALIEGITAKHEAYAATAAALPSYTYNNGTGGVGATITANSNGALSIDGQSPSINDYVLIKNETAGNAAYNGLYTVTATGDVSNPFVLTRALSMNSSTEFGGAFIFVQNGAINQATGWSCTSGSSITVGTTAVTFVQFSGAGTYTAGTGLSLTGTQFSLTTPVSSTNGGTGLSSIGTGNQILGVNNGGTALEYKTVTAGTGVSISHGTGTLTINNTGVTSVAATTSSTGLSITGSPITTTGTLTFSLNNELQGLAGLTATGFISRTAAGTYSPRTFNGTTNQISVTNGDGISGAPVIAISNNVVLPGTGSMTVPTGTTAQQPAAAIGQIRYDSTTNVLMWSNATSWSQFGTVTSVSGSGGTTGLTLTGGPITGSGTLTLGGTLGLSNGGTNATLTASNGGIVYSTSSAMAILSGTATAGQMLQSGASAAPSWSTATYPSTATSSGTILRANGTNWVASTSTFSDTYSTNSILYASSSNTVSGLAVGTANQILGVNTGATGLEYKTITAGTGITITPTAGTITIANSIPALQLYKENPSSPTAPSATGTNSVAIGNGSTASAINSTAIGLGTNSSIWGGVSLANGSFATAGDAQTGIYHLRATTTDGTVGVELFLDGAGASQRLVLPNNSLMTFTILISARRTDATGGGAGYKFEGVIKKDTTSGSTTLVGTPSKSVLGETNFLWNSTVSADTTNGSLKIAVTGETSKTIRWVATVMACVVTN